MMALAPLGAPGVPAVIVGQLGNGWMEVESNTADGAEKRSLGKVRKLGDALRLVADHVDAYPADTTWYWVWEAA